MADAALSIDPEEVEKFSAMAEAWWDPEGNYKPLHKFNPVRLEFLRDRLADLNGTDPLSDQPLKGLKILDIGCGGGLLCEPLTRLGAQMTGVDASEKNIKIASLHAKEMGLKIDYRHSSAEELAAAGEEFDAVLNMEVVEHVADVESFLEACAALVKPGGVMVLATLNRTAKSYALAIVGAEYILRWLPRGTHDWRKFLKPSEVAGVLRPTGLEVKEVSGVAYNPLNDSWRLAPRDTDVNYMMVFVKL